MADARNTWPHVQASQFAALDHGEMGVWEALHMLNELREYEAALMGPGSGLDPDMPLLEHAFQVRVHAVQHGLEILECAAAGV